MKPIYILIALFFSLQITAQSPWTQEKGRFFANLSYSSISDYSEMFGEPDFSISGTITDRTYQFYGEYGLTNKTSLLVNVPLKSIDINNYVDPAILCMGNCAQSFSETALGNITLGLKHNFLKQKWVLSGQLNMEINTSSYDETSAIRTGYDAYTFTPMFLAGTSFGKNYFQSFIGADIRTNNYSSNLKIGGEIGRKLTQNIWIIGFVDISQSLNNGDISFPANNAANSLYVNDQEYVAYGLKGILQFCDFGLTAGFGSALSGNNVPKKAAISFGVFKTF
jgi:hypothetical protein